MAECLLPGKRLPFKTEGVNKMVTVDSPLPNCAYEIMLSQVLGFIHRKVVTVFKLFIV